MRRPGRGRHCAGRHPPEEAAVGKYRAHFDDYLCERCYSLWRRLGRPQDVVDVEELHRQRNGHIDARRPPEPEEDDDDAGW